MKDREKEIKYLLYLEKEIIKESRKRSKELREELNEINGIKKLKKDKNYHK